MPDELFPPDDDTAFKREYVQSWPPNRWAWLVGDVPAAVAVRIAQEGHWEELRTPGSARAGRRAVAEQVVLDASWPVMLVHESLGDWVVNTVTPSLGPGEFAKLPDDFRWAVEFVLRRRASRGGLVT